jgi:phage shock protein C
VNLQPDRPDRPRQLRRSEDERVIAGVLGGIARHLGVDPTRLRIVYVLVSILSAAFPGILVYLLLWYLIPAGDRSPYGPCMSGSSAVWPPSRALAPTASGPARAY